MTKRSMPTDPIQRAGAVASDYGALQGLAALGVGVGLIVMSMTPTPIYGAIVMAVSIPIVQAYYVKKYGRVRQSTAQIWKDLGAAILVVVLAGVGIIADLFTEPPIMLGALAGAVALLIFVRLNYRTVGATRVQLGVVVVLAVCSLLPLVGLFGGGNFWRMDLALLGLALIVFGVVDHRRLALAMRPVEG